MNLDVAHQRHAIDHSTLAAAATMPFVGRTVRASEYFAIEYSYGDQRECELDA